MASGPVTAAEWKSLAAEAAELFVKLKDTQARCPDDSIQQRRTNAVANSLSKWWQFVQDNRENWKQ